MRTAGRGAVARFLGRVAYVLGDAILGECRSAVEINAHPRQRSVGIENAMLRSDRRKTESQLSR